MSRDPYRYFRVEGRELAEGLGKGVLELERAFDVEIVLRLLRLAHTLKGAARVVKLREIGDLAHAIEGELAPHRAGASPPSPERIRTLLALVDAVVARLDALEGGGAVSSLASDSPSGSTLAKAPERGRRPPATSDVPRSSPAEPVARGEVGAARQEPPSLAAAALAWSAEPSPAVTAETDPSSVSSSVAPREADVVPAALAEVASDAAHARVRDARGGDALDARGSSPPSPGAPVPNRGGGAVRLLRADAAEMNALLQGVTEVSVHLGKVRQAAEPLERARRLVARLIAASPRNGAERGVAGRQQEVLFGELEELVGRVSRHLARELEDTGRELGQVRAAAERLRLLPVSAIFDVLTRTARDAAEVLGKSVRFEGRDGGMRLEGEVLAGLQGALIQLVRNAVVHGLERAEERRAAGKPPTGTVAVEVLRRGKNIVISCRDDGRGIDLEGVRAGARRGGMSASTAQGLSREELLALLLRGGISTAREVTELAGRAVGVDLVREVLAQCGGAVTVETEEGRGTTFRLELPASLSSWEVLLVRVAGETFAVPLASVRRTLRLAEHQLLRVGDRLSLLLEEDVVPFASLERLVPPSLAGGRDGARARPASQPFAIVVASGAQRVAWGVDALLGAEEVLIRELPPLLYADRAVAGAALDAAGEPLLVLDGETLVTYAQEARAPLSSVAPPTPRILVVDDSLTTRMLEQSILETAGFLVDVATSGEEGLARLGSRRYDLVLVDVEMPGMDGFAFITALRARPEVAELPAILVSSRSSPEDKRRGEEVGASGYVVKSEFDQVELLGRIRRLIARAPHQEAGA